MPSLPLLPSTFRRPSSPLSVVRLVVSTDGEQYTVVDVTGARDGSWIRQRILAKVRTTTSSLHKLFLAQPLLIP